MEGDKQLMESMGLSKKLLANVRKNEELAAEFARVIKLAEAEGKKEQGSLLLEVATASFKGQLKGQTDLLVQYVKEEKIASSKQFKGALSYLKKHKEGEAVDVAALEQAAGVGIVVSQEAMERAVSDAFEKEKERVEKEQWGAMGALIKAATAQEPWAEGAAVRDAVCKQLEAKFGEKPKGGKGAKGAKKGKKDVAALKDVVVEKPDTPFTMVRVGQAPEFVGKRVAVRGWIDQIRRQKKRIFLSLRDAGSGYLQVILEKQLTQTKDAQLLKRESSVVVYGAVGKLPEGKHADGGIELHADYLEVVGMTEEDIEERVGADTGPEARFDQRHLVLRGRRSSAYLQLRSIALHCMRQHFFEHDYFEVCPPTMVQTSAEGGSDLFQFDFFGEQAYLTQSSQLYLETVVPSVGKTFCILPSFRAEKSRTRRHLAEYTHLEAELPWITFDDLMSAMEDLLCDTVERLLAHPRAAALLKEVNPDFQPLKRPFRRMSYTEAVQWCRDHKVYKLDESGFPTEELYEWGEDLPESAERAILAEIDEPIFLNRFPVPLKAFYMSKCKDDPRLTESVDLLLPGVGEVIGGSMRIWDFEELDAAYKREKYDPTPYYWYTDQRKFGSVPHGGYGLGVERFLVWLFADEHIKNVCLYPRHKGRCKP